MYQSITYQHQKLLKNIEAISLICYSNIDCTMNFNLQECNVYSQSSISKEVRQELINRFNAVGLRHFAIYDLTSFDINYDLYQGDDIPVCKKFKIAYFFPNESIEIFEFTVVNADYKAFIEQAGYKVGFDTDFNQIAKFAKMEDTTEDNNSTDPSQIERESSCLIM